MHYVCLLSCMETFSLGSTVCWESACMWYSAVGWHCYLAFFSLLGLVFLRACSCCNKLTIATVSGDEIKDRLTCMARLTHSDVNFQIHVRQNMQLHEPQVIVLSVRRKSSASCSFIPLKVFTVSLLSVSKCQCACKLLCVSVFSLHFSSSVSNRSKSAQNKSLGEMNQATLASELIVIWRHSCKDDRWFITCRYYVKNCDQQSLFLDTMTVFIPHLLVKLFYLLCAKYSEDTYTYQIFVLDRSLNQMF